MEKGLRISELVIIVVLVLNLAASSVLISLHIQDSEPYENDASDSPLLQLKAVEYAWESTLSTPMIIKDKTARNNIRALQTGNQTFNTQNYAQSEALATQYYGYCKQTSDLMTATLKDKSGRDTKIWGVDATLCADDGENANSNGYLYRYIVNGSNINRDAAGIEKITGYMICAWPETIGKTGSKFFITNQQGTIYWRKADMDVVFPLDKWPDEKTLKSDWKPIEK